jgi:hypothetical protein
VVVGVAVSNSPAAQIVKAVQVLSADALLTTSAYSDDVHTVVSAHCLSKPNLGATLSNWVEVHVVSGEHTALLVLVAGVETYSPN